jgi:hypothetical protein
LFSFRNGEIPQLLTYIGIEGDVATLALGSWPRQRLTKVRTKNEAREPHFMFLGVWECERMRGHEPPHSQVSSHFGNWNPDELPNLQRAILRVKTHWIEKLLISLESSWNLDV